MTLHIAWNILDVDVMLMSLALKMVDVELAQWILLPLYRIAAPVGQ